MDEGLLLLVVGAILCASVLAALAAARTGVPVLVGFLVLGMLLGSDGPGGIDFDDVELAREVGIVGLVLILFEGGLQTSWRRLRDVAVPAAMLGTGGVVVTAVLTGAAAQLFFDLTWLEAILLGAVVASTDAAAVFATLRFTHIRRRVARTLEAESGVNDPTAIALTVGLIAWIESPEENGFQELVVLVVRELALGLVVGVVLGLAAMWIFARLPDALGPFAPVASLAAAGVSFGVAEVVGGSGFLAVYLVGLAIGSTPSRYRRQLVGFHEGLAFLAQVTLFIVFGLLVFPSQLLEVALSGLALSVLLVVVARPIAVFLSVAFSDFSVREQLLLGWAGLRGAVPIVLATFVLSSEIDTASTIFNAVFFVVLVSTIVQGTTLEWVAGRLDLLVSVPQRHEPPIAVPDRSELDLVDFLVAPDHAIAGAAVREVGLPRSAIIAVVVRGDDSIPPRGSTIIEPGDRLYVLGPRALRPDVEDVFSRWRRRV
jgi:cell volume regulation protein A